MVSATCQISQPEHIWPLGNLTYAADVVGATNITFQPQSLGCFPEGDPVPGLQYSSIILGARESSALMETSINDNADTEDLTLAMYINPDPILPNNGSRVIFTAYNPVTSVEVLRVSVDNSTISVFARKEDIMQEDEITVANFIQPSTWNHLIMSIDGSKGKIQIYIGDQQMFDSSDYAEDWYLPTGCTFRFGSSLDGTGAAFKGRISCIVLQFKKQTTTTVQYLEANCHLDGPYWTNYQAGELTLLVHFNHTLLKRWR